MAKFTDYLDSLGVGDAGAVMYPETFDADIRGAYDFDMQGASATISQLQAEVATLQAQNTELAAANWNLLQSIPTTNTVEDADTDTDTDSDSDDSDDDPDNWFE